MTLKRRIRKGVSCVMDGSGISRIGAILRAGKGVRVLTYHGIEAEPQSSFSVTPDNLEEHLKYLKRKYRVIAMDDYVQHVKTGSGIPKKSVVITFDDGLKSFYDYARPLLKKYDLPATVFIVADLAAGRDPRFMHGEDLRELAKDRLFRIGSHSLTHASVKKLSEEDLMREVSSSKAVLEEIVAGPVTSFSYPYGTTRDWDRRSAYRVEASGYELAFTSVSGVNTGRRRRFSLRRTKIEWADDLGQFKRVLRGALDIWVLVDYCFPFLQKRGELPFMDGRGVPGR